MDLTLKTVRKTDNDQSTVTTKKAVETYHHGLLQVIPGEVVSTDFVHCPVSSVFDAGAGMELNSRIFKLTSSYDNAWGCSS